VLLLACAAACSHESAELAVVEDARPFEAATDGPIGTATGLDTVPLGAPVSLVWFAGGAVSYAWELVPPPGSGATLDDGAAASPSFSPDVLGEYSVRATVQRTGGGTTVATRTIRAAAFAGAAACGACHVAHAAPVAESAHGVFAESCEECHGPGDGHDGDPRRIGVSLRPAVCARCHDGSVASDRASEYALSAHGNAPPGFLIGRPGCARCHTTAGFLASVRGEDAPALGEGTPGPTCAACHDPHARNPALTRLFGATPLASGGAYDGGRAAACLVCHQGDVADPAAHAAAGGRFPCAVQADMLAARGGVEYGLAFGGSFHGTTVFRRQAFTGDPDDPDTPDACVVCHMAPGGGTLGGHTMRLRASSVTVLATGNCDRCHAGLDTFDFKIGRDFDGNGVRDGVQTEVRGLLERVWQAIAAANAGGGLSRPDGAGTPIEVDPDPAQSTAALRAAAYNYNFVVVDGSLGIHNTTYTIQLLQRTYEQVTGKSFGEAFPRADIR
jgi:hypothetical protein